MQVHLPHLVFVQISRKIPNLLELLVKGGIRDLAEMNQVVLAIELEVSGRVLLQEDCLVTCLEVEGKLTLFFSKIVVEIFVFNVC